MLPLFFRESRNIQTVRHDIQPKIGEYQQLSCFHSSFGSQGPPVKVSQRIHAPFTSFVTIQRGMQRKACYNSSNHSDSDKLVNEGANFLQTLLGFDPKCIRQAKIRFMQSAGPTVIETLIQKLERCKEELEGDNYEVNVSSSECETDDLQITNKSVAQTKTMARSSSEITTTITAASIDPMTAIPIEVLRQVTQSDFLTVQETGCFLLLVSRSFTDALGKNQIWKTICHMQWKNMPSIPKCIIEARGYEWIFRQRVTNNKAKITLVAVIGYLELR